MNVPECTPQSVSNMASIQLTDCWSTSSLGCFNSARLVTKQHEHRSAHPRPMQKSRNNLNLNLKTRPTTDGMTRMISPTHKDNRSSLLQLRQTTPVQSPNLRKSLKKSSTPPMLLLLLLHDISADFLHLCTHVVPGPFTFLTLPPVINHCFFIATIIAVI